MIVPALLGRIGPIVRSRGKEAFLKSLGAGASVLDIGCGNDSPMRTKRCAPSIQYTGLDIADYNQHGRSLAFADEYIVTTAHEFAAVIEQRCHSFDAVVSSHNLEHCDEPGRVLRAACDALKPGGRMYLSFPSEASAFLPRRPKNTLNFYDDPTHTAPPELSMVRAALAQAGVTINFIAARYRPAVPALVGFLLEPVSIALGRSMPLGSTWALHGFETVIWATRGEAAAIP